MRCGDDVRQRMAMHNTCLTRLFSDDANSWFTNINFLPIGLMDVGVLCRTVMSAFGGEADVAQRFQNSLNDGSATELLIPHFRSF